MNFLEKILYLPDFLLGYEMGDPFRNGEYRFLASYLRAGMTILDVGANIGEYAEKSLSIDNTLKIHCFEPVHDTYQALVSNINLDAEKAEIIFCNFGLGDRNEEAIINVYGKYAGANSVVHSDYAHALSANVSHENIAIRKLDDYLVEVGVNFVDMLKIDVEGYEAAVLQGALSSIRRKMFGAIQFEYGGQWQNSGASLYEQLHMLQKAGYSTFRLTPWGKLPIKRIGPDLENYKHCNYLALKK
jgi:FkbM family methyltransferase